VDLPYSSSGTPHVYVDLWLKLFTTVDDIGCPVDSCLLMNTDCTSTPAVNTNFYMLAIASPWALSAKLNLAAGWGYQTFCIKCLGTK